MHKHAIGGAIAVMCLMSTAAPAQTSAPPAPASKKAPAKTWTAPKTGWGDPDLSGVYTNNDESLIPFERPVRVRRPKARGRHPGRAREAHRRARRAASRRPIAIAPSSEPAALVRESLPEQQPCVARVRSSGGTGPAAHARGAAAERGARANGPPTAPRTLTRTRSLYDRCISRGIPGSMMPAIYGNAYEIVQGPGYVGDHVRDGSRGARHPARRPPAPGERIPHVYGRRARPLGGQHPRRGDDELHGRDRVSRLRAST